MDSRRSAFRQRRVARAQAAKLLGRTGPRVHDAQEADECGAERTEDHNGELEVYKVRRCEADALKKPINSRIEIGARQRRAPSGACCCIFPRTFETVSVLL